MEIIRGAQSIRNLILRRTVYFSSFWKISRSLTWAIYCYECSVWNVLFKKRSRRATQVLRSAFVFKSQLHPINVLFGCPFRPKTETKPLPPDGCSADKMIISWPTKLAPDTISPMLDWLWTRLRGSTTSPSTILPVFFSSVPVFVSFLFLAFSPDWPENTGSPLGYCGRKTKTNRIRQMHIYAPSRKVPTL